MLFLLAVAPALGDAVFHEPNAVLVNITEEDLNLIVREAFHANGASRIEGVTDRPDRGITGLRYEAGFSEPVLTLGRDGHARLDVDILEAELSIGSIERKLLARRMRCENAGVSVERERPVDVTLDLQFAVRDHDLRIVPEEVRMTNTKGFLLQKPTRCRNNPLPEFLMWWIGKGRLRRKIERLDDVLLAKAHDGAEALAADGGLLAKHWRFAEGQADLHLYPQTVDTSHGTLLISLAGSSPVMQAAATAAPGWVGSRSGTSFLGLSESFLNHILRTAFRRLDGRPREPSGGIRKLLKSEAVHALIPGLRGIAATSSLQLGFAFHALPTVEFDSLADQRAVIRIRITGVEMMILESIDGRQRWLGSVNVDSANMAVAPYLNVLGGISFETVENDWRLSSRGIEFDEEILAATFQELFFSEVFETSYEPLARESFEMGRTRFDPRYFNLVGDHLVIGLTRLAP